MFTILLLIVSGCNNYLDENEDAESELASNDVWHAAKLRGVAFRARGQEPGWLLEIINGNQSCCQQIMARLKQHMRMLNQ